jgi:hypothetical protein
VRDMIWQPREQHAWVGGWLREVRQYDHAGACAAK